MGSTQKPRLVVELVPRTCSFSNARTLLPKSIWDKLRKESYEKAGHKCEICSQVGTDQGYRHRVECHEIWHYDDVKKIQTLKGLISLCPRCHQAKHIGRTTKIGKQPEVFKHMGELNGWNHKQIVTHLADAYKKQSERSKFAWKLDLQLLITDYNLDKKLINEAEKKRFK